MSDFVLSAVLELRDRMTGRLRTAARGLSAAESMARTTSNSIDRAGRATRNLQNNLSSLRGNYSPTISVRDTVTPAVNRIRGNLAGMAGRSYSASVVIRDNASSRITRIQSELRGLTGRAHEIMVNVRQNGNVGSIGGRVMGGLSGIAGGMMMNTGMQMAGSAGIGYGLYDTVRTFRDFEQQMSAVSAIAGVTGDDLKSLSNVAREIGSQTKFSAVEAGKAMEYMALAGWKKPDIEAGVSPLVDLAAATGEDLATVSDILTDAMTGLKIDVSRQNARHFADVLATAASNSNTTVAMMGEAFKYAAPSAGVLGFSDSDISAMLGLMANSGIKASQAGTAANMIFSKLASGDRIAEMALNSLGVDISDASRASGVKSLRDIMIDLRTAFKQADPESLMNFADKLNGMKGIRNREALAKTVSKMMENGGVLDARDQTKFAKMLAGQEHLAGLLSVVTASEEEFQKLTSAIDNCEGAAGRMAKIRMNNLAGDMDVLKSTWDEFQLSLMEGKGGEGIRAFVQTATKDLEKFTKSLKDGFDFSDVASLGATALTQLKDKALQMDGIGSVLAGGTLLAGAYKASSAAAGLAGRVRDFAGRGITPESIGNLAQSTGHMVINATSVVVNGRMAGSGAGTGAGAGSGRQPRPARGMTGRRASAAAEISGAAATNGRLASAGKIIGRLATPLMVASGIWEAYNVSQENETALKEVQALVDSARPEELQAALIAQKAVETENTNRMGSAVGSASGALAGGLAGAKAGAAIGTFFGGPAGTAIGGAIGGIGGAIAGSELGAAIGNQTAAVKEIFSSAWDSIKVEAANTYEWLSKSMKNEFDGMRNAAQAVWEPFRDSAISAINFVVGSAAIIGESLYEPFRPIAEWMAVNVWTPIKENAMLAWQEISAFPSTAATAVSTIWSGVSSWLDSMVWQPVSAAAGMAWNTVSTVAGETWISITALFSSAASWFDSTVWQPISSAVSTVQSSIVNAFESAWSAVTGLWASAGAWFEANVISPIKEKFNAVASIGASITGLGIPGHAIGTSYFSGGFTEVNEHGGEIIDLPQGSRIYPHATTMEILRDSFGNMGTEFTPVVSSMGKLLSSITKNGAITKTTNEGRQVISPNITVTGNEFVIREDADIDRIAHKLSQLIEQSAGNYQWLGV